MLPLFGTANIIKYVCQSVKMPLSLHKLEMSFPANPFHVLIRCGAYILSDGIAATVENDAKKF